MSSHVSSPSAKCRAEDQFYITALLRSSPMGYGRKYMTTGLNFLIWIWILFFSFFFFFMVTLRSFFAGVKKITCPSSHQLLFLFNFSTKFWKTQKTLADMPEKQTLWTSAQLSIIAHFHTDNRGGLAFIPLPKEQRTLLNTKYCSDKKQTLNQAIILILWNYFATWLIAVQHYKSLYKDRKNYLRPTAT